MSLNETNVLLLTWHGTAILPVLRSLAPEVGRVVLLHGFPNDVVSRSVHARPFVRFEPTIEDHELVAEVVRIAAQFDCHVLFPADDRAVEFVSRCRPALARHIRVTPNPEVPALDRIRSKVQFTHLLGELGLDHPRSVAASPAASPATLACANLRSPWMVKAAARSGGQGIFRCETPDQVDLACAELAREQVSFLVQEWVPGPDVDCSFLAMDGTILALTTQRSLRKGAAYAPATEIMLEPHPGLAAMAARLAAQLNWSGLAHLDAIRDERDGSYKLLELNPRCWGSLLASTAAGVNFPKAMVQAALGLPVPPQDFSPTCFYMGGLGLRRFLGFDGPRWAWKETDVPFFLEDPWPEWTARRLARKPR